MRVLVIRFSAIGDIVLTSPVLRCLRQQQSAEIYFLTKAVYAEIPAANPFVGRVFAWGPHPLVVHEKIRYFDRLQDATEVLKTLEFDAIIDLHHNLRSFWVKRALKAPTYAFHKLNFEKWLLVNTGINLLPDRHIVHRYMDTVAPLGVRYDGQGLDFHIPPAVSASIDALPAPVQTWKAAPQRVAFAIGATHATKRLPESKIVDICRRLPGSVVLLGGPGEKAIGARIAAAAGEHVHNACGDLSLFQSAEILSRSQVVITHDTGLMHIAAALRKKVISIWGNTVPAFGMYPLYPDGEDANTTIEVQGLGCRPCSKIGGNHCPKGHFNCMNLQKTEAVVGAISF